MLCEDHQSHQACAQKKNSLKMMIIRDTVDVNERTDSEGDSLLNDAEEVKCQKYVLVKKADATS
ncbi:hypothetical protein Hanom_Chr09g00764041 [Helianthus anomalus]